MKRVAFTSLSLFAMYLFSVPCFSQATRNFIKEWTATAPETNPNDLVTRPLRDVKLSTTYFDGLGRPQQSVVKQGSLATSSGSNNDLVVPFEYDNIGRVIKKYLPYVAGTSDGLFKDNAITNQNSFYVGSSSPVFGQNENTFYTQTDYEPSPLNRITKQMAPGASWAGNGKGVSTKYWINTDADQVRIWNVLDASGAFGSYNLSTYNNGVYPAGSLYKNVTEDENDKQVIEFKDKEGKLILKKVQLLDNVNGTVVKDDGLGRGYDGWLNTYYVYDDLGRLRCVIQPNAVEELAKPTVNWQLTASMLDELCFRYEYDAKGRMTMKKVSGAAAVYMVYDVRDRLVFTQDGNLRSRNQWLTTLYDASNRPVLTGLMNYNGSVTDLQASVTQQTKTPLSPNTGLLVDISLSQPNTTGTYQAMRSIDMTDGFETTTGGEFTAEIVSGPGGADGETSVIDGVAVNKNPIPSTVTFSALTFTHYDDYNDLPSGLSGTLTNSGYGTYLTASSGSPDYADPITQSTAVKGMVTWTKIKVLGTASQFNSSVNIYDDKGRVIQTQGINITGGLDLVTNQYSFSGQVLRNHIKHQKAGSNAQNYDVASLNNYDDLGRVTSVEKNINNKGWTRISSLEYDALGQLKSKRLAPDLSNPNNQLEKLVYDYNIRGWLFGMNRANLANNGSSPTRFAFELGFDKITNSSGKNFTTNQLNGNVTGMIWKSAGDGVRRKYDFSYDNSNRFMQGIFEQNNPDDNSWNNSKVNYTVKMGDGSDATLAYDANGNIKSITQYGWKLGQSSADPIDNLSYFYFNGGNKLQLVTDLTGTTDNKLGDFTDKNTNGNDYGYDVNGNLITDLNKKIGSATGEDLTTGGAIDYNYLNLPQNIVIKKDDNSQKGTITYVYDAAGTKLQKITVDNSISGKTVTTTSTYIGSFIYESRQTSPSSNDDYTDKLQFIATEEGRIRPTTADVNNPFAYYDYFIKDHLGNVRMVLTAEPKTNSYPAASMEDVTDKNDLNDPKNYIPFYANTDYTINASYRTQISTDVPGYPVNDPNAHLNATNNYVAKVKGGTSGNKLGPYIVLKVMAGDMFNVRVSSWYKLWGQGPNPSSNPLTEVVDALSSGIASVPNSKNTSTDLKNSGVLTGPVNNLFSQQNSAALTGAPKAYLNWILLDDQFNYVVSSADPVPQESYFNNGTTNPIVKVHLVNGQPVTKNGYLYVFVSNETPNIDVYFDNLQVTHIRGSVLEETHYYPFGLVQQGISSKAMAFGNPENKIKFQGQELASKEFTDGSGLDTYEFKYRMHDPQIGRFWQIDPLANKFVYNSTYAFSANKVTRDIELEGLENIDYGFAQIWRSVGISSSSDPKEFIRNVGNELTRPKTWFEATAQAGMIAVPIALTTIMTGGFGDAAVFESETKALSTQTMVAEPLGEQWGRGGLIADEGRTTTLLGSRQGYWGEITENAEKYGVNLVPNKANPTGYSYLNVETEGFDLKNNPLDRERFFNTYNKPFIDAAITRGDRLMMLDNPFNTNAIFPGGDMSKGFNFYGMETDYLSKLGFTFSNGEAIYPMNQSSWHPPMLLPSSYKPKY